ncbi:glycosyltransferase [Aquirufa sp. LEOWEIH-7C]|uniref:Glycosyltransferase n=2 Tax=Aquirufa regiilacus TaxID=3024868 RepID=A0ABU3TSQ3_9BACT|nr:glycosyltransferase [Aquirufa sp. LEOWEIH-7C]
MKNYAIGGVEVVSQILANKFYDEGHKVTFVAFEKPPELLTNELNKGIVIHVLDLPLYSESNVLKLKDIIIENNIDIIINQWGLPFEPTLLAFNAKKGTSVKYISVQHNVPNNNDRLVKVKTSIANSRGFNKYLLKIKKKAIQFITAKSMHYVYFRSDAYILLSQSFIPIFKKFINLKHCNKLEVITNPITIDDKNFNYSESEKRREVIYVGRLDHNQKRVSRIIESWGLIESNNPDWKLTLIGDGPEKSNIISQIKDLNLRNVTIEGFQNPKEYYKRSSILLLTSEYEGFPLVIAECMHFGVVPIVYGSYPAVYDIIRSEFDGIIVSPDENGFNSKLMAENLEKVMKHQNLLQEMAKNAIHTSKRFSVDKIYNLWLNLFERVINQK